MSLCFDCKRKSPEILEIVHPMLISLITWSSDPVESYLAQSPGFYLLNTPEHDGRDMGRVLRNVGKETSVLFPGGSAEDRDAGHRCCVLTILVYHHLAIWEG